MRKYPIGACLMVLFLAIGCSSPPATSPKSAKQQREQQREEQQQVGQPAAAVTYEWRMMGRDPTRNAVSPERDPPIHWNVDDDQEVNVKWTAALGRYCISEPVVADGLVWIGTDSLGLSNERDEGTVLLCLKESTGEELYRYYSPPPEPAFDYGGWPLGCSPLVQGNRLWFTNNRCEVICLDITALVQKTGGSPTVSWKVDMREELGVHPHGRVMFLARTCSIASYRSWIYVVTGNGVDKSHLEVPAPRAPSLVCFNKDTGDVVWEDNSPGHHILHSQRASPLAVELAGRPQVIVPQGDGWVRSFDPAGNGQGRSRLLWEFDMNLKAARFEVGGRGTRNNLLATPVCYDGKIYIATGQEPDHGEGVGRLCCIDPTKSGDISAEAVVDADGVVVAGDELDTRRYRMPDPRKGERVVANPNSGLVWQYGGEDEDGTITGTKGAEVFRRTFANVAIADDLVIAPDLSGRLHCVDVKTGKRCWEYDLLASLWASPLIVDGKVFIVDEDGIVSILRLSRELDAIAKIEMPDEITASPTFVNGVLYIASDKLYAITGQRGQEP